MQKARNLRPSFVVLLVGLMCASAEYGFTQAPWSLQHQNWSTEAGLPQSSVHQILQSREGYIWLATEGGAVRYDGVSFKILSRETNPNFTSNDVTSLAEDRNGNLWFGTADGLIESPAKGDLRHFGQSDGLPASSIVSVAAGNDGSILVLTSGGIVSYDGSHFKAVDGHGSSVERLLGEADGSVILVSGESLLRYRDNKIQPLTLGASFSTSAPRGVALEQDGAMWLWTDHEVVASTQGKQYLWQVGRDFPGSRIQALFVDRRSVAWVGTNRGLVAISKVQQQPTPVPNPISALGANSILSLMEDGEGNLWIGTDTSGLHTLRPRTLREQPALADDEVSCVTQASDGSMWIGTRDDGLRRLRPGSSGSKLDRPVANAALTSPVILSLAPGLYGDVWAGTPDGLSHVEASGKSTRYTSSDGLPDDLVRSLLAGRDGILWVGTRHGLAHLQSGRFDTETPAHSMGNDLIGTLYESGEGDLWIGTLSGLSRRRAGVARTFTSADGLSSNLVTGIAEDNAHRLWVTTRDAGVFLFDGHRFAAISPTGMPQEFFGVVADTQGFLWLRGRHGVVRGSAAELAQCADRAICQVRLGAYGVEDGMPSEEIVTNGTPSVWSTSKGEIWFATRKGVAIADPAGLSVNTVPPPVVIERFLADSYAVPLTSGTQSLPSGHTRYTFEYAGLSYTVPSKVLYRSRLEEFDPHWSDATNHRSASYTNLPPGRYTFRVQAANNDGLWNDVGAQVQFRILPPFYRRWWFLLTLSLTLIGFSALLYRLRVRRLQHRFDAVLAERSRIAREIHDTLAQDFVGVSLQLDLVSQFLAHNSLPDATTQLKATRSLVNAGLERARQSIWNLRANSTPDGLPARVTTLAQRFSAEDVVVNTKIGGAYRALPSPIEEEVLKIMQEALSNVQRHAVATGVNVQLTYEQDKLIVAMADNGRGFSIPDAAARPGHFGLQGMRERALSLGAELNLTSTPGKGTILELVVPIGKKGLQK